MKKSELPQDKSALKDFTREVCYVKNDEGKYETGLSEGWETKSAALDQAWNEVDRRIAGARQEVIDGTASPVFYFMELRLMDMPVLKGYTGLWGWQIKRHFKPSVFNRLPGATLEKYAAAFDITVEKLKQFKG